MLYWLETFPECCQVEENSTPSEFSQHFPWPLFHGDNHILCCLTGYKECVCISCINSLLSVSYTSVFHLCICLTPVLDSVAPV